MKKKICEDIGGEMGKKKENFSGGMERLEGKDFVDGMQMKESRDLGF